jgi:hypothetical protein
MAFLYQPAWILPTSAFAAWAGVLALLSLYSLTVWALWRAFHDDPTVPASTTGRIAAGASVSTALFFVVDAIYYLYHCTASYWFCLF